MEHFVILYLLTVHTGGTQDSVGVEQRRFKLGLVLRSWLQVCVTIQVLFVLYPGLITGTQNVQSVSRPTDK